MKYTLRPKEMPRAKPEGFSEGSGHISSYIPTRVTIQAFSITILEELILCIALTTGAIFSSVLPALLGAY